MSTTNRLQDGQLFARYEIVRLIGEGGMGSVYEAIHPVLKKRFAIKTLLPSIAQTPEVRARFLREGEAASRISHPNVVDVTDVGTEDDTPYLVMEFLEGETLADLLDKRGRLDVAEALDLLLPVVSAVVAGHDAGVVHRDLKPQNVFLARGHWGEAIPKVLDFGVSKLTGGDNAALTGTLAVLGTAAYMSPEQARGARHVDGQSDQYALGLVLYEVLTGARAHPGDNPLEVLHNIASGTLVPPRQVRPDLPEPLAAVLTRMLALAPAERFPSLRAAGRALFPFAGDRSRAAIRDAFRDPQASTEVPGSSGAAAAVPRPPSGASASSPAVGRTQLLPETPKQPDTTFSSAAVEVPDGGPPRRGRPLWIVGGLALPVVALVVWASIGKDKPHAPEPAPPFPAAAVPAPIVERPAVQPTPPAQHETPRFRRLQVRAEPAIAEIRLDDFPAVPGRLDRSIPDDDAPHSLRITAPGHEPMTIALQPHQAAPAEIKLTPSRASPPASDRKRKESVRRHDAQTGKGAPKQDAQPAMPKRGTNNAPIIQ